MLYCNIGKYYDTIYVLNEYFNNQEEKNEFLDLSNVSPTLAAFFWKINNNSYLQKVLKACLDDLSQKDTIKVLVEDILNIEKTVNGIIGFYFPNSDCVYNINDSKFIEKINNLIIKSNYTSELKYSLYSFFINPLIITQQLLQTLLEIDTQIAVLHNNKKTNVFQIQNDILNSNILSKLNLHNINKEEINFSITILNSENIEVMLSKDQTYLIFGEDYKKCLEKIYSYNLADLGNILTQKNRIEILNLISKRNETTIKEIKLALNLSGTNAYYHLSMMVKANMIITRNIGRTIYYGINKEYFADIINALTKYINP